MTKVVLSRHTHRHVFVQRCTRDVQTKRILESAGESRALVCLQSHTGHWTPVTMSNVTVTRAGSGAGLQEDRWGEVLGLLGVGVVSLATTTVLVALVLRVRYSWRLEDARRLEAVAAPRTVITL